ncbi:MAG TPA: hypothetical protein VJ727_02440 [Rhodanobacteraceae bacterium]|nr:hypothetical protein [Rhodanobacteraceae bacterium]
MPVPTMLARGVAFALMGAASAGVGAQDYTASPATTTSDVSAQPAIQQGYGTNGLLGLHPNQGPAAQLNYTLELGAEHSNNINLSETDPISQDLLIPRLYFSYDQIGSVLQAHAVGQIEYRDYLQGDFGNEFRGNLAAALNWIMLPERLAFAVTDNSGIEPINPLANNAPTNVQQTNVFSAGPSLLLHFSDALRAQADLRYINTTASKTKYFDSQRGSGAFRVIRELNATDQVSANLEAERVHFTSPSDAPGQFTPDYDNYNLYGRYQSKLAQVQVDATLGWSRYAFAEGAPDHAGVTAQARIDWEATPNSVFEIGAARQFTDASEQLMVDPTQIATNIDTTNIAIGNSVVTPQIYLQKRIDASYAYHGPRFAVSIAPYYQQLDYLNDPFFDQRGPGVSFSADYRLRPLLTAEFAVYAEHLRYTTIERNDDVLSYGPSLTDQLTPHWSWRLNLTHNRLNTTQPGLSYTENLVFFVISYKR